MSGSIPALQPLLLGSLQAAHRLTAIESGQAATWEGLSMAVSVTVATLLLPPRHLRLIAILTSIVLATANALTPFMPSAWIMVMRAASGVGAGLILWLLVGALTRASSPGRLFAVYVTSQSCLALVMSFAMARIALPHFGSAGSYGLVSVLAILILPAIGFIPRSYPQSDKSILRLPTARGTIGIVTVTLHLAGVMAFWVFVTPIGVALGHDRDWLNDMIGIAVGFQLLGGLAAVMLMRMLPPSAMVIGSAIASAVAVLTIFAFGHGSGIFLACACAFSFLWMAAPPFQLPFLLELDHSQRSAAFISPAQLGGMAIGPLLGSMSIGSDVLTVLPVSALLFGVAIVTALLAAACKCVSDI